MAPTRSKKRKSDESNITDAPEMADHTVPTETGSPVRTPTRNSPMKKRRKLTLAEKQGYIDNLQLEVTERARRMRAQYNRQIQSLRTNVEIRVQRIPRNLLKEKMGDVLNRITSRQREQPHRKVVPAPASQRPPPVPEKDVPPSRPLSHVSEAAAPVARGPGRPPKRLSDEMAGGNNKENLEAGGPKKRLRASPAPEIMHNPARVLSPTSSNSRVINRKRVPPAAAAPPPPQQQQPQQSSPAKSLIARPVSPVKKPSSNNLVSNMIEKARSTRAAAAAAGNRKTTTSTTASSAASGPASSTTTAATRTRRGAAAAATATAASTRAGGAASRTARRISMISESSDGSTSTVVRKRGGPGAGGASRTAAVPAPPPPAAAAKRTVMGTIRKGVAGATARRGAAAAPPAAKATGAAGTGRVLRKRG